MNNEYATPADIQSWLADVEYRDPAVVIDLFLHEYEGYNQACLAIHLTVANSYRQGELQVQAVMVPMPPIASREHFHDWLKWRMKTIVLHELNEMFWVDGKPLLDPHDESYWQRGQLT